MCDGSHVKAGMHSMLPDGQEWSRDTAGWAHRRTQKFLTVVMPIGNLTRGILKQEGII